MCELGRLLLYGSVDQILQGLGNVLVRDMGFKSILFKDEEYRLLEEAPAFFQDLQLDYLVERILGQTKGYRTERYFYTFPEQRETIGYRQQICRDLESDRLYSVLQRFCKMFGNSRKTYNLSLNVEKKIPAAAYHLQAAMEYWEALQWLKEELADCELVSEGMSSFYNFIKEEIKERKESGFEADLEKAVQFFLELHFRLSLDPDKLMVEESKETPGNYFRELAELLGQEPETVSVVIRDIFPDPLQSSYMESMLVELLRKSKPEVFQKIKGFYETYPTFYPEALLKFEEEIQFYLSYMQFKKRTEGMGYAMETPVLSKEGEFRGEAVYDLALAWKQENSDTKVVSNEFVMEKSPSFFVVTGPNQGGKTTFARSMGQAVYFTLLGLPVNAKRFITPMFQGIATHFEVEERLQSNSGKLKEEINRLLPMMTQDRNRGYFVILNELFTTATTHDAMIMGRKVMESFLKRNCYGIYVTHIQELAEEKEGIISLVAQLEPGEEKKRSYRMLRMPAQGYGYSDVLVKKFGLEYDVILRRLG